MGAHRVGSDVERATTPSDLLTSTGKAISKTVGSLLAARRWMLKGPFVVEGFTSGAFAGLLAAAAVGGGWLLAQRFATATFAEVLPGVGLTLIEDLAAGIILAGIAVGSLTAWSGLRRLQA